MLLSLPLFDPLNCFHSTSCHLSILSSLFLLLCFALCFSSPGIQGFPEFQLKLQLSGSPSAKHKLFEIEGQVWKSDLADHHLMTKSGVGWWNPGVIFCYSMQWDNVYVPGNIREVPKKLHRLCEKSTFWVTSVNYSDL